MYFIFRFIFYSGLFYEKHLKYIKLNDKAVEFTKMDLSFLHKVKSLFDVTLLFL